MKKYLSYIILGLAMLALGYVAGIYESDTKSNDEFLNARKEAILWRNIAHQYWQYYDYDDRENHIGHGNFFLDVISESDTYDQLSELNGGDFEDFFYEWESHDEQLDF